MAIVTSNTNLTAVSYTAGEIIEIRNGATLTINSTPAVRPGTIQCITSGKLRIENSSTTTPLVLELQDQTRDLRFENAGVLEIRGNAIEIGTSTGATQTWDFSTLYSGAYTDITHVEVETAVGSGEYDVWPVMFQLPWLSDAYYNGTSSFAPVGSPTNSLFDGDVEIFFFNSITRVLSTGNGTNGALISSGRKIRIPNILITEQYWRPDAQNSFALCQNGSSTTGTFTISFRNPLTGVIIGTTAAIARTATFATIQTAIQTALPGATVTGLGTLPSTVTVTLGGTYAGVYVCPEITNTGFAAVAGMVSFVSTNANHSLLDLSPLGTFDAEWCMFSNRFFISNLSNPGNFKAVHVGFGCQLFRHGSTPFSLELDHVSVANHGFMSVIGLWQIESIYGSNSRIYKLTISGILPGTNASLTNAGVIKFVSNLSQCDDICVLSLGRRSVAGLGAIAVARLPSLTFRNWRILGGAIVPIQIENCTWVNLKQGDTTGPRSLPLQSAPAIRTLTAQNLLFVNFGKQGLRSSASSLFSCDVNSSGIRVIGGSYDGTNGGPGLIDSADSLLSIANFTQTNMIADRLAIDAQTSSNSAIYRKIFMAAASGLNPRAEMTTNAQLDLVGCDLDRLIFNTGSINFVGANFADAGATPTTGHVTFGGFFPGTGFEAFGDAYSNQSGQVILPTSGDSCVATIPFAVHGVTSFQNVTPRLAGEVPNGFANKARVRNNGTPTGGTFTITIYDATDTLIGTTGAIAYNAPTATVQTAIQAVTGAGTVTSVTGTLDAGYVITFASSAIRRVTANGANLTGGTQAGTIQYYAVFTITLDNESAPGLEFACRVPGTSWPAYQTANGTNLSGAIAALSGYAAGGIGLEMRLKVSTAQSFPFTQMQQVSFRTNINPSLWVISDSFITLNGPESTDVTYVRKLSDLAANPPINLYTFTGGGIQRFDVGNNFDEEVYFVRENAAGVQLMTTYPTTQQLKFDDNGEVDLFYGTQVQLAQNSDVESIKAKVDAYLDVAISTRLTAAGYIAPDNASITAIKVKTDNLPTSPAAVEDIPTAPQVADTVLRRSTINVETSITGDPINLKSLYGMVAQGVHNTQVAGATLTVTKSDDATVLGTRTVTTNPNAEPITGIDSD